MRVLRRLQSTPKHYCHSSKKFFKVLFQSLARKRASFEPDVQSLSCPSLNKLLRSDEIIDWLESHLPLRMHPSVADAHCWSICNRTMRETLQIKQIGWIANYKPPQLLHGNSPWCMKIGFKRTTYVYLKHRDYGTPTFERISSAHGIKLNIVVAIRVSQWNGSGD